MPSKVYKIAENPNSDFFDAAIELDANAVILHSRGGALGTSGVRNADYSKALRVIIRRLRDSRRTEITRVLLDSTQAKKQSAEDRVLVTKSEYLSLTDEQFISFIRKRASAWGQQAGAKGGNSTKQLRVELTPISQLDLRSTLQLQAGSARVKSGGGGSVRSELPKTNGKASRLPHSELHKVTAEQIHRAIDLLRAGADAPNFHESSNYDVITGHGDRFAPKKVFGLALQEALGFEIFPGHFSAGKGTPSFSLIQAAGYMIVPKGSVPSRGSSSSATASDFPATDDDRAWAEGDQRRVSHLKRERASGLSAKKKAEFFGSHRRLFCERCGFEPSEVFGEDFLDACLDVHHTIPIATMSEGQKTKLDDLELLCANCHRYEHRRIALANNVRKQS